jgi:multicomponent Na+:H+ antiporter subunit A
MLVTLLVIFATALVAPTLVRRLPAAAGWLLALVPAGIFAWYAWHIAGVAGGQEVREAFAWVPQLDAALTFRLDGLSLMFALLITGIGALIVIYAAEYLRKYDARPRFFAILFLFMGAMLGVVLADNVIALFVFWELTSFSSFLLIGFEHDRPAARRAALQALLVTGGGGLALFAGLLVLGNVAGTYSISEMGNVAGALAASGLALPVVLLVGAGAMTKSALVPFHFWLPNAMEAPAPVSSYLHSATMVKAGIYLIARMNPHLGGLAEWSVLLMIAGSATALFAAAGALRQTDLKRILAWSTVSSLGLMALLLSIGTEASGRAAILFLVAHAFYKAALFQVAGAIDHELGARDYRTISGLARPMPILAAAAVVAAASLIGLPPLAGAVAKDAVYAATFGAGSFVMVITGVVVVTSTLLVVVAFRAAFLPFFGRSPSHQLEHPGTVWALNAPPLVLAFAGALAGIFAAGWIDPFISAAATSVGGAISSADPSPLPAGKAWLGYGSIVIGLALALLMGRKTRDARDAAADRFWDAGIAGTLRSATWLTNTIQSGYLRLYLSIILAFTVVLLAIGAGVPAIAEGARWSRPLLADVSALGLAVGGALLALFARSRLVAVIALSAVGVGASLFYMLHGAPDVAMTQILVDILTVIFFMLAFQRLPQLGEFSGRFARYRDAVLATSFGLIIGLLTYFGMTSTTRSPISIFFAENSVAEAHGRNIVNVILVDFRALDTLGEISVLGAAGLGVYALLKLRRPSKERT